MPIASHFQEVTVENFWFEQRIRGKLYHSNATTHQIIKLQVNVEIFSEDSRS